MFRKLFGKQQPPPEPLPAAALTAAFQAALDAFDQGEVAQAQARLALGAGADWAGWWPGLRRVG
ncbi:MAG: hypothetical protein HC910_21115, partial [Spirulinaceae cyanobacterium SM2_1_0]|nr:hypothetical protein [Spirulinaceae cyanobacterium SM2_1_0]